MAEQFVGVTMPQRSFLATTIRTAFARWEADRKFNICALHGLPEYDCETFAAWASECHCKSVDVETWFRLKAYCVNYFLCPDAQDHMDVAAAMLEV